MGYGYGWMHGGGWGFWLGALFWIVLAVGLVVASRAIVWQRHGHSAGSEGPRETALQILQKRYARGDISREEFEQKRPDLSEGAK